MEPLKHRVYSRLFLCYSLYMKKADAFTLVRIVFAPIFFLLYFIPLWTGFFVRVSAYVLLPLLIIATLSDRFDYFPLA